MQLAEVRQRRQSGLREQLAAHRGGEGELADGRADGGHDAFGAQRVEVLVFVEAAAEVEDFEAAVDRDGRPACVSEVGVADRELAEGGDAEEGGEGEVGAEEGVVGDVGVV